MVCGNTSVLDDELKAWKLNFHSLVNFRHRLLTLERGPSNIPPLDSMRSRFLFQAGLDFGKASDQLPFKLNRDNPDFPPQDG